MKWTKSSVFFPDEDFCDKDHFSVRSFDAVAAAAAVVEIALFAIMEH